MLFKDFKAPDRVCYAVAPYAQHSCLAMHSEGGEVLELEEEKSKSDEVR